VGFVILMRGQRRSQGIARLLRGRWGRAEMGGRAPPPSVSASVLFAMRTWTTTAELCTALALLPCNLRSCHRA